MDAREFTRAVIRIENLEARVTELQSSIFELQRSVTALTAAEQPAAPGASTAPLPGAAPPEPAAPPLAAQAFPAYAPYTAIPQHEAVGHIPPPPPPRVPRMVATGQPAPAGPVVKPARPKEAEDTGGGLPQRVISMVGRTEFWLNKVGIVLFLFGIAFLFKYAVDRNWLNETVRVIIGAVLATGLIGFGLYFHGKRRHFSQVLLGGGIAAYYITTFAAYVLFPSLGVPYEWAFGAMATITALAFLLAVEGGDVSLSIIGLIGGMLTPYILSGFQTPATELMIYLRLLVLGIAAIYLFTGWRMLLWSSFALAWLVMMQTMSLSLYQGEEWSRNTAATWEAQATIIALVVAFWGVPLLHRVLTRRYPKVFRTPSLDSVKDPVDRERMEDMHVYVLPALVPLLALWFSASLWGIRVDVDSWGLWSFAAAAVYGVIWWLLRHTAAGAATAHKLMGVVLFVIGTAFFLGPHPEWLSGLALYLALAVEAVALHLAGYNWKDRGLKWLGAGVTLLAAGGYALNVLEPLQADALPALNSTALANLLVLATFAVSGLVTRGRGRDLFELLFHAGVLAWLWRELSNLPQAEGYTMLACAAYATLLFVVIYWLHDRFNLELTRITAGLFYGISALWLATRIGTGLVFGNPEVTPIFNHNGMIGLGILALGVVVAYTVRADRRILSGLALALHAIFLGWLWQELGLFPNGNGIVTVAWGIDALLIIGAALKFNRDRNLFIVGAATLFAVAAKLFLVDLYYLEAIWRILLFLGFGALFLVVSYYLQNITRHGGTMPGSPHTS
jgi:uncharacterized membrane protein